MEQYEELFAKLTEPREFHIINLPKNIGYYGFEGYVAGVEDVIEFVKEKEELPLVIAADGDKI